MFAQVACKALEAAHAKALEAAHAKAERASLKLQVMTHHSLCLAALCFRWYGCLYLPGLSFRHASRLELS